MDAGAATPGRSSAQVPMSEMLDLRVEPALDHRQGAAATRWSSRTTRRSRASSPRRWWPPTAPRRKSTRHAARPLPRAAPLRLRCRHRYPTAPRPTSGIMTSSPTSNARSAASVTRPGGLLTVCRPCGQMLAVRYDLPRVAAGRHQGGAPQRPPGMYRFRELLPLADGEEPVTLGEGGTPLLELPRLAAHLGPAASLGQGRGPEPDRHLQGARARHGDHQGAHARRRAGS